MQDALVLDTNLAVLYFVGQTNVKYIEKHKRLRGTFDAIDYILTSTMARADRILFTPNVLSETSNLIRYIEEPLRGEIASLFGAVVGRAEERFVESKIAVSRRECKRLGLTDAVLLEVADTGAVLLTVDVDLYLAALHAKLEAINYNHLRELRPDFR